MITGTVRIGPHYTNDDIYGRVLDDRVCERHIVGQLAGIGGRINRVVIDLGDARYPLIDPGHIRQQFREGVDIEIVGSRADVVHRVVEQLDPHLTSCADCVDWLPCPTHLVPA